METHHKDFTGKKAFITGSSRGIGRALALELAERGCDILIHYRKNEEAAQKVKKEVNDLGVNSWVYQADLCDSDQTLKMLSAIKQDHQHLDIYVANAASTAFKSLTDINTSHIQKTFHLVVQSFLLCVQELKPLMAGRNSHILTISGIDTVKYCPGHGLLAAAKSSLETLSKYLAVELSGEKIHVKCVNPGLVATDSTRAYLGDEFNNICQKADQIAPQGGTISPEHLAKLLTVFLKNETNWMSAQTIYMDGGVSFLLPDLFSN